MLAPSRKHLFLFSLVLLLPLISTQQAKASDYQSPRTAALGGAGHGGPILNDAIYLNPAFAAYLPTYSVSGSYLIYSGNEIDSPIGKTKYYGRNYNFSIQDGRNELFKAGAGITVREDKVLAHFGAAKKAIEQLGFGLGAKMSFESNVGNVRELTFSAIGIPMSDIQLALIVDNLIQSDRSVANNMYREFILGSKFNYQKVVSAYFDPHFVPSLDEDQGGKFGLETGLEFAAMADLFFRIGMFLNSTVAFQNARGDGFGFGGGWVGPKFSLDYAYQVVSQSEQSMPAGSAHVFGMTLYF